MAIQTFSIVIIVFAALFVGAQTSAPTTVPGKSEKVCCYWDHISTQVYDYVNMKYYHLTADHIRSLVYIAHDGHDGEFRLRDLNNHKEYFFNGSECYYEKFPAPITQCLYATPEQVHAFKLTVPQGDVTVKAVHYENGNSKITWFVYIIGGDICMPLSFSTLVNGHRENHFYSHSSNDLGVNPSLLDADINKCIAKE